MKKEFGKEFASKGNREEARICSLFSELLLLQLVHLIGTNGLRGFGELAFLTVSPAHTHSRRQVAKSIFEGKTNGVHCLIGQLLDKVSECVCVHLQSESTQIRAPDRKKGFFFW